MKQSPTEQPLNQAQIITHAIIIQMPRTLNRHLGL